MTNKEIIVNAAVKAGMISPDEAKYAIERDIDIPLHTVQGWTRQGSYKVRDGEEGIEVKIWKKKVGEDKFYLTKAYLYRLEQLETI